VDPAAVAARALEAASRYGPQGYAKDAPGFGHTRVIQQHSPPQSQYQGPPQSQRHYQALSPPPQYSYPSQAPEPPPQSQPWSGGEAASFASMDAADKAAAVSFLEWCVRAPTSNPSSSETRTPSVLPCAPRLSPLRPRERFFIGSARGLLF
jgi:hypothetical protein